MTLSPQRIDEGVHQQLVEKCGERMLRMRAEKQFVFCYVLLYYIVCIHICAKFYYANEDNAGIWLDFWVALR